MMAAYCFWETDYSCKNLIRVWMTSDWEAKFTVHRDSSRFVQEYTLF